MDKIKQDISIGDNLRNLRKRMGLSQELRGLSVSREMLSQMELGRYNIRVSVLLALKDIYNATFEEIFENLS